MTLQGKKALAVGALCGAGAMLLLRPGLLVVFAAGAWLGRRGLGWLRRDWLNREV